MTATNFDFHLKYILILLIITICEIGQGTTYGSQDVVHMKVQDTQNRGLLICQQFIDAKTRKFKNIYSRFDKVESVSIYSFSSPLKKDIIEREVKIDEILTQTLEPGDYVTLKLKAPMNKKIILGCFIPTTIAFKNKSTFNNWKFSCSSSANEKQKNELDKYTMLVDQSYPWKNQIGTQYPWTANGGLSMKIHLKSHLAYKKTYLWKSGVSRRRSEKSDQAATYVERVCKDNNLVGCNKATKVTDGIYLFNSKEGQFLTSRSGVKKFTYSIDEDYSTLNIHLIESVNHEYKNILDLKVCPCLKNKDFSTLVLNENTIYKCIKRGHMALNAKPKAPRVTQYFIKLPTEANIKSIKIEKIEGHFELPSIEYQVVEPRFYQSIEECQYTSKYLSACR